MDGRNQHEATVVLRLIVPVDGEPTPEPAAAPVDANDETRRSIAHKNLRAVEQHGKALGKAAEEQAKKLAGSLKGAKVLDVVVEEVRRG